MNVKHILSPVLKFSVAVAAVAIATPGAWAGPHIKWLKSLHQFGAFNEDIETVNCKFVGVNTGDETLVIFDVKPNCGCTTTKRYAGLEYEPGDTIEIEATYNAVGRPGRFSKKLLVTSNADQPKTSLTLTGTVIGAVSTLSQRYPVERGPVMLHTSTVLLGDVYKGRNGGAYVRAYNRSNDTLAPVVTSHPKYLSAIVEPKIVAPGEQFVISLNHFTGQDQRWGLQNDTITVVPVKAGQTPEGSGVEPFDITSVVTMKEDFSRLNPKQLAEAPAISLLPAMIDLKRLSVNGTDKIVEKVEIKNQGKSDLVIRQVSCVNSGVELNLKSRRIKPGKHTDLTVTIDPARLTNDELIDARIIIIANDPVNPTTVLRIVGEIVK